jgi:NhaP-type Na+/H+ or K+/H+ antiporter
VPRNWRLGILWSGLSGAISVVLVLGVGVIRLPHIEGMTALTFGVVLATNLIQGLSMSRVVKNLELSVRQASSDERKSDA